MPSQTQSTATGRSRLKRRAGTQQPLVDYTIDETPAQSASQSIRPDIQEVYEQAIKRPDRQTPPKRARLASVDATSDSHSRATTPANTLPADGMDIDEGEEQLDFVEKTLQRAAQAKKAGRLPSGQLMPPPNVIPTKDKRTTRSPSEESEAIEPPRKALRAASPPKKASTQSKGKGKNATGESRPPVAPATQDTAFLQAIAKNVKSRKAIDELDKEFNQLRIPKPGAQPGSHVVKASAWNASHPDWNLVNDFDDDLRGNFIEIIRVDLMRKDGGRKEPVRSDQGVPNFKKFKKACRIIVTQHVETDQSRRISLGESLCEWLWWHRPPTIPKWASVSHTICKVMVQMLIDYSVLADSATYWQARQRRHSDDPHSIPGRGRGRRDAIGAYCAS